MNSKAMLTINSILGIKVIVNMTDLFDFEFKMFC